MSADNQLPTWLRRALLDDSQRLVFSSREPDETQERVSEVFKPHRLKTTGALDARMHSVSLGQVSFNRLRYGAEVQIDPERLEQFYLIQMPLSGRAEIQMEKESVSSFSTVASILNPTAELSMRWSADCDQLMLRIERKALELACSQHLGHPLRSPLCFKGALQWLNDPNWSNLIVYLARLLKESPDAPSQPLIAGQLEQLIISTLLSVQPHNYFDELHDSDRCLAPRHVKKVEEYIEAHADEPLTPAQLAEYAGVSVRTLHSGFHDFRHQGPMEYLRTVRLRKVKAALEEPGESRSVTEIALSWGFGHTGRFSQEYRKAFGERPSETRRKFADH
ncbi:AraC family transcriptional regulator [Marinobacterium sedimentorum]|uniref:AraC family transcriptional regulator n=1 Tax=Marinobacterium sedimentorum TaxID=2927804 RepID=UPI0020C72AA1|nr:AraC family transcriptional regulator [Marinobacterium sedimentorum]MCP8689087.1 AraC family transcriptional regulator [Marinobacterium sedimentorum]